MKRIYSIIIVALFCFTAIAQTPKADRLFKSWDYFRAAKLYEKEAEKNPGADVYFKLGECYRIMKQYKNEQQAAYDKVNAAGTFSNVSALNTDNADFCPVFYKDGVLFTSSRKTPGHEKIYGWTGANYMD